jgi:crotonobetainyl-CoA:carnitine CoA-transferase CaiB-like acyl-CoA transferase
VVGADGLTTRMPSRPFVMERTPWRMSRPAPLLGDTAVDAVGWEVRPQPAQAAPAGGALPLKGIRVIELGTAWAAPCGTKILADLGADVLKIESPTHPDNARVGPFTDDGLADRFFDRTCSYLIANTSKAHLALELSTAEGQAIFRRLVAGADVVVENYTPRVMQNFGLGYEELRRIRPGLIMLSSCGYGHTGPWSGYSAYGWSLEPGGGIADVTGYPDGPPVASAIPYPDIAAALHGAFSVLLALEHRRKTGEAQAIDLAQYELAALSAVAPLLQHLAGGSTWGRHGNRHPWYAPHNIYASAPDGTAAGVSDNWVAIAVESDEEWPRLVKALGGALEERPAWASFVARKADEDAIDAQIRAWTQARTAVEAAELLQRAGVRAAPVNRYDQALRNPQPWHRGYLVRAEHEESGTRIVPGPWMRFGRTPARVRWAAPNFGAQNRPVLEGLLGLTEEEIAGLYAAGVTADRVTGLARPAIAALPIDQAIELGMARGKDPDFDRWNHEGPAVPYMERVPFTWGAVPRG